MLQLAHFFTSLASITLPLGLLLLVSGRVKFKNELDVVVRVVAAFCIAMASYWVIGYSLSSTPSFWGVVGAGDWVFDRANLDAKASDLRVVCLFSLPPILVSAILVERGTFMPINLLVLATAILVAPITAHWAWAGLSEGGLDGAARHLAYHADGGQGWLAARGFMDKGGTVIFFAAAGFAAMATTLVVGPRKGRFPLLANRPRGHSPTFHFLGAICLILGLSLISTNQANQISEMDEIVFNVLFGSIFAFLAVLMIMGISGQKAFATDLINAGVAGSIAMTAFAAEMAPASAALTGMFAGSVVLILRRVFAASELDDTSDLIAIFLAGGMTGGLVAPIMRAELSGHLLNDIAIQLLGLVTVGLWSFGSVWLVAHLLHKYLGLRSRDSDEMRGLSRSYFSHQSEPDFLIAQLQRNSAFSAIRTSDLSEDLGHLSEELSERIVSLRGELHRAIDRVQSSDQVVKGATIAARMRQAEDTLKVKTEDILMLIEHALADTIGSSSGAELQAWIAQSLELLMAPCFKDLDQFTRHIPLQVEVDELENLVHAASESLSRCAHQVEQVRDFGVAHLEGQFSRSHQCDLAELLDQKAKLLIRLADMQDNPLQIDAVQQNGIYVSGNKIMFARILSLMVEAAFHRFVRRQGRPIRLELSMQNGGQTVVLDCLDTGIALSARQIKAITEPMSEDIKLADVGLGQIMPLVLASRLVQIVGGEASLSSEQGLGTRISYRFRTVEVKRETDDTPMEASL